MISKYFPKFLLTVILLLIFYRMSLFGEQVNYRHWILLFSNLGVILFFYCPFVLTLFIWQKKYLEPKFEISKILSYFVFPFSIFIIAIISHLISMAGLFLPSIVFGIWFLFWIPVFLDKGEIFKIFLNLFKKIDTIFLLLSSIIVLIFIDIWFAISGTGSLYPPLACDHSLLHLVLPRSIIQNGSLGTCWWVRAPWHPLLIHHLYSMLISFSKSLSLQWELVTGLNNIFFVVAILCILMSILSKKNAFLATILFISFPVVQQALQISYLDIGLTLWVLGVTVATLKYFDNKQEIYILLAVLFSALAFSTKHMGAFYVLPQALSLIIFDWVYGNKKIWKIRNILYCVVILCSIFVVVFGRNFYYSGNPIFPFLGSGSSLAYFWDSSSTKALNQAVSYWKGDGSLNAFGKALIDIITDPSKLSDTGPYWIGPLGAVILFTALGVAIVFRQKNKTYLVLFSWTISMLFLWFLSSPVVRYLIPVLSLLVLFFFWILENVKKKPPTYVSVIMTVLLIGGIVASNKTIIRGYVMPPPLTPEDRARFLKVNFLAYDVVAYIKNNSTKYDVTYSLFDECQRLYYTIPTIGDWFGGGSYSKVLSRKPSELKSYFSSLKIRYVVANAMALESTNSKSFPGKSPIEKLFGEYSVCLTKINLKEDKILLYELNQKSEFCFENRDKLHPGYEEMIKNYNRL